jgi:hypothetical protein
MISFYENLPSFSMQSLRWGLTKGVAEGII